jgi:hypothetical protein
MRVRDNIFSDIAAPNISPEEIHLCLLDVQMVADGSIVLLVSYTSNPLEERDNLLPVHTFAIAVFRRRDEESEELFLVDRFDLNFTTVCSSG